MNTYKINMTLDGRLNLSGFTVRVDSIEEAYKHAVFIAGEYKGSKITELKIKEVNM